MLSIFQETLQCFLKAWNVLIQSLNLVTTGMVSPAEITVSVECSPYRTQTNAEKPWNE